MRPSPHWLSCLLVPLVVFVFTGDVRAGAGGQATVSGLKILVIEGESATNVVQQKTAIAPVIEVRDRNDQPVAGAVVRFAIKTGRASFNGARTLTVTTNAAGRAAVASLTPTGSGALQISATVSFQGQTAAVTIVQTNFMTAAQAATATAGGTGGGLSATTVAIAGGAAAGGTLVLKEAGVLGGGSEYVGSFSGIIRYTSGGGGCFREERHEGEIRLAIETSDSGTVGGSASIEATATVVTVIPGCEAPFGNQERYGTEADLTVTGSPSNLTVHGSQPGAPGVTFTFDLIGVLSGDEVSGTYAEAIIQQPSGFGGSQSYPVTLRK